jgi:hypothetical protein
VQGNYAVVSNGCGASIYVKASQSDPSPKTIANGETALVMCDGTSYAKAAGAGVAFSIAALAAGGGLADANYMAVSQSGTDYKVTLGTLKTYLGITAATASKLLAPASFVCTNNQALIGVCTNQDGQTAVAGLDVLLVGQSNPVENGVWTISNSSWARSTAMPNGVRASNSMVPIDPGTGNFGGSMWRCVSPAVADAVGTNQLLWARTELDFSGVGDVQALATTGTALPHNNRPVVTKLTGDASSDLTVVANRIVTNPTAGAIAALNSSSNEWQEYENDGVANSGVRWTHYKGVLPTKQGRLSSATSFVSLNGSSSWDVYLPKLGSYWNFSRGTAKIQIQSNRAGGQESAYEFNFCAQYLSGVNQTRFMFASKTRTDAVGAGNASRGSVALLTDTTGNVAGYSMAVTPTDSSLSPVISFAISGDFTGMNVSFLVDCDFSYIHTAAAYT